MHCPGKLNPADIPSRGFNLSNASNLKLWLNGPQFLLCTKDLWPSQDVISYNSVNIIQEEKKVIENVIKLNEIICFSKFSSYDKLVRVIAYVKRFIFNTSRKGRNTKILEEYVSLKEFSEAENLLLFYEQQHFSSKEEFNHLFNSLNVFVDKDDLIKVEGRLQNAPLNPPVLLNKDSYVTHLIIWNCHNRRLHSGVKDTLTYLRQRFWVPRGRQTVRKVIKDCVICLKQNSKPFNLPSAPPLPTFRVNIDFPFANTGVDYLGPLFVRNIFYGNTDRLYKVYIALYLCASTRGVYLDVVPDASSRSFVNSMKRFVSRHGIPKFFISDNGKNFIGPEVKEYIRFLNTDWDFILEHSPWWGGFWERLVQLVKRTLRKILKKNKLTFEEMSTVVTEIEGILNTRPLCYVDDDSTDTIITPSHLIYGRNLLTKIPSDNDLNSNSYGKRFKHIQTLISRFWKSWTSEYLTELRERHKNIYKTKGREIKLGELVLLKDEIIPRSRWRVGRVYKLHKGTDNKIRGACLKVINDKNNVYVNRPITKLCPLEVSCELRPENSIATPNTNEDNSLNRYLKTNRPKRNAAVTGILKREYRH